MKHRQPENKRWKVDGYKKGCTGKVLYVEQRAAIARVNHQYAHDKPAQAYKCYHCKGFHMTTTDIRKEMRCPADHLPESNRGGACGPHGYRVTDRYTPGEAVVACMYCGVRLESHECELIEPDELILLKKAENLNDYQSIFVKNVLRNGLLTVFSVEQKQFLRHILSKHVPGERSDEEPKASI